MPTARRRLTLARSALLLSLLGCDEATDATWMDAAQDAAPQDAAPQDAAPQDAAPDADLSSDGATLAPELIAAAQTIQADALISRVAALSDDALQGRDQGEGGARARALLLPWLEALPVLPAGAVGFESAGDFGTNLLARLPGQAPELPPLLLLAHYDHVGVAPLHPGCHPIGADRICNGAADNASGVAVALEVVDALAAQALDRDVLLVLTDGEEDGLLGSRALAEDLARPPIAFLNLDTLGATAIPGLAAGFALGVEYSPRLGPLVIQASAPFEPFYPVSRYFDGSANGERSDARSLWDVNVPGLFLGSGTPPEYHTAQDEVGRLSPERLEAEARAIFALAATLGSTSWDLPFTAPAPHLGDAVAVMAVCDAVLANPDAFGLSDAEAGAVQLVRTRCQSYLDHPPTTPEAWAIYERFIQTTLSLVFGG